ncbi:MAG: hypothetical protein GX791_04360 [Synergistaceae bacterium]|nr:hypothetical protein [Synergistaceae bacterium]
MDAPLIIIFPHSDRSGSSPRSPDFSKAGGVLALFPSLSEDEGKKSALSEGYHVLCSSEGNSLTVINDSGMVLLRYSGLHEGEASSEEDFPIFFPGGLLCALSFKNDIFLPEHARLLALGGAEFIIFIPPPSKDQSLLEDFARVRAVENQIFTALMRSFPDQPLFYGPGGESLPPQDSLDGGWISLEKRVLLRATKNLSLRDLRRQEFYHGLTAL